MLITIDDKQYKLCFVKRPCRYWQYEYHIILRAVKNAVWDKYIGYIGRAHKNKFSKPFLAYRNLPTIYADTFTELKQKTECLLSAEYLIG